MRTPLNDGALLYAINSSYNNLEQWVRRFKVIMSSLGNSCKGCCYGPGCRPYPTPTDQVSARHFVVVLPGCALYTMRIGSAG